MDILNLSQQKEEETIRCQNQIVTEKLLAIKKTEICMNKLVYL